MMSLSTNNNISPKDQLLIFILLFYSVSPLIPLLGSFSFFYAILVILFLVRGKLPAPKVFLLFLAKIVIALGVIFLMQFITLGFLSVLGALNYISKVVLGALIAYYLGPRFPFALFKVLTWLCFLSVIGFIIFTVLKVPMFGLEYKEANSFIVYATTSDHPTRNEGMCWEPGAFAGLITIILALNFTNLSYFWAEKRLSLIFIALALLSTQSTTGYLVGFIIFVLSFLMKTQRVIAIIFLPLMMVAAFYAYSATDFLDEKITAQYKQAKNANKAESIEFSNTRFGSLLFDLHYIEKHPYFGNGLHEKTRYADHPFLIHKIENGENIGNGNGFSNYLACMGIPFMVGYFILVYRSSRKTNEVLPTLGILIAIALNLQGEQWLPTPLYLGLPFMSLGLGKTYIVLDPNKARLVTIENEIDNDGEEDEELVVAKASPQF